MVEKLNFIFGHGEELSILQMCMRAIVVFSVCLVFLRLSGRRSFGMRMPFDNVITILLGALLSRTIVGASPFWPTIAAGAVIVILHRLFAWIAIYYRPFGKLIKGDERIIYKDGKFIEENMRNSLISYKDLIENIRLKTSKETLEDIQIIYVERNGEISVIKKQS